MFAQTRWESIDDMLPEDGQKPLPLIYEPLTTYKPILVVTSLRERHETEIVNAIVDFLTRSELSIRVVNIAGHREDACYGIQRTVQRVLTRALKITTALQKQGAINSNSRAQNMPVGEEDTSATESTRGSDVSEVKSERTLSIQSRAKPKGQSDTVPLPMKKGSASKFGTNWLWWNKFRFAPQQKKG